jgi:8-oxo-dGTP pyrophosphatase MutT (NUDIX family)
MKILEATPNPFRGIVLNPAALPTSTQEFRQRLQHSLAAWKEEGYRVVWLEIPIAQAPLIPIAVEAGFVFHHTNEGHVHAAENYLMLTYRLEEGALIPAYASHYIGVGGVVLNDRQELLVVSEQHRRDKSRPYYKLPGGALHQGEHLVDGAIREVLEETGVQTKFESVVCFRHWHGYRYGKSDIYFICRLSPLNEEISRQDEEIEECLWMPVGEYLNSDYVALFNRQIVQAALTSEGVMPTWIDGYTDPDLREFFMPKHLARGSNDRQA